MLQCIKDAVTLQCLAYTIVQGNNEGRSRTLIFKGKVSVLAVRRSLYPSIVRGAF